MSAHNDHFDIDDEFLADHEATPEFERTPPTDRADRRNKQANNLKRGKAAWSKLEDVLAEKRLEKELNEVYED
jgi:hypothetical protein